MLKELYDLLKRLLLVAHESQQNKTEIKELRQEIKDLTAVVQRLAYEIHRVSENEAHEREKDGVAFRERVTEIRTPTAVTPSDEQETFQALRNRIDHVKRQLVYSAWNLVAVL